MSQTFVLIFIRKDYHLTIEDGQLIKINVEDVLSFRSLFDEKFQGLFGSSHFLQFEWEISFVFGFLLFVAFFFFSDFSRVGSEDLLKRLLFEGLLNLLDKAFALKKIFVSQVLNFIQKETGRLDLLGFEDFFDFRESVALLEFISEQFG